MTNAGAVRIRKNTQQKHQSILDSACRLFLKHGYTHTSMDAIAADAGVSKQTVYSYFSNKELLFRRMVEELCSAHTLTLSAFEDSSISPEKALLRFGHSFMDTLASRTGLCIYRLVMAEAPRHPRVAELFFQSGPQKMQIMLMEYLKRQVTAGHFIIPDLDHAAAHFFSMLKGWYQMRMVLKLKPAPSKKELTDYVHNCVQAFCKAYAV